MIAHVTTASGVCVCVRGVGLQGDSPCDYSGERVCVVMGVLIVNVFISSRPPQ